MTILRRITTLTVGAIFSTFLGLPAGAQNPASAYPNGPIRFIVPATAGGTTDILARLVGKHLADAWHVPVTVDNRAGAGGSVGALEPSRTVASSQVLCPWTLAAWQRQPADWAQTR